MVAAIVATPMARIIKMSVRSCGDSNIAAPKAEPPEGGARFVLASA
jgi:hypothetical protein